MRRVCESYNKEIYNINKKHLENVFVDAESGKWDQIYHHVLLEPSLLNTPFDYGPLKGKTLPWIAAYQIASGSAEEAEKALCFLEKILDMNFKLNIEVFPSSEHGKSVLWLLSLATAQLHYDKAEPNIREGVAGRLNRLWTRVFRLYPNCDINAAPKDSVYKGTTVFLLSQLKDLLEVMSTKSA